MKRIAAITVLVACVLILDTTITTSTPLDDYVHKFDPHYNYTLIKNQSYPAWSIYYLKMVSQKWTSENVVNNPIWWHYLTIVIPKNLIYTDSAFLYIDGGSNNKKHPNEMILAFLELLAFRTGSVSGIISMIPNEPLVFKDDPTKKKRGEDSLAAWSWMKFMDNTSYPEMLIRLPMTKATVRAMDTISSFVKQQIGNSVDKFFVAGASKRAWTAWLTAAVDKRVVGVAPIVMDLLNIIPNLHHHYRAYGGWSFAFGPYYSLNLTMNLDTPEFKRLADIVDPFVYKSRYKMPMFIVSTTGDEFFLPDDADYYFKTLPGEKHLRVVPNAEHSCIGHLTNILHTLEADWLSILKKTNRPQITWYKNYTSSGASITVNMDRKPSTIKAYYAVTLNNKRRDFRLLVASPTDQTKPFPNPVFWLSREVDHLGGNMYRVSFSNVVSGEWRGFFIQRIHIESLMEQTMSIFAPRIEDMAPHSNENEDENTDDISCSKWFGFHIYYRSLHHTKHFSIS